MKTIEIAKLAGTFAENKDIAREIRLKRITPALKNESNTVILDFKGVTGATQSFVHALLSQLIRKYDSNVFTRILFKNCNDSVKQVVNIVADYMEATK